MQIRRRSHGIPLVAEELARSLSRRPAARAEPGGATPLPTTLQELMANQLDKLDRWPRQLAVVVAAMDGAADTHSLALVHRVNPVRTEAGVEALVHAGILSGNTTSGVREFSFSHDLLRVAAYDCLLAVNRQRLHARIASVHADCGRSAEQIARHYALSARAAGELGEETKRAEMTARALPYWLAAGQRALDTGATREAVRQLDAALETVVHLASGREAVEIELQLQLLLGRALSVLLGWSDARTKSACARAIALCSELEDFDRLTEALDLAFGGQYNSIELDAGRRTAERMIAVGRDNDFPLALAIGLQDLGMCRFAQGRFEQARTSLEASLDHIERAGIGRHGYPSMARSYLSLCLFALGERDEATALIARTLHEVTLPGEDPYNHTAALGNACYLAQLNADLDTLAQLANELVTIAKRHGFFTWLELGRYFQLWAAVQRDFSIERFSELVEALECMMAEAIEMSYFLGITAQLCLARNDIERAQGFLDRAVDHARGTGEAFYLAELLRMRGDLLRARYPAEPDAARRSYRDAIAVARSQGARVWEARARHALDDLPRVGLAASGVAHVLRVAPSDTAQQDPPADTPACSDGIDGQGIGFRCVRHQLDLV